MKVTEALFGLLVFGLMLYLVGQDLKTFTGGNPQFTTYGSEILEQIHVENPEFYENPLNWMNINNAVKFGVLAGALTMATVYFAAGAPVSMALMLGLAAFLLPIVIYPAKVVLAIDAPWVVKVLTGGFVLFLFLKGVGAAIRGEI